MKNLQWRTIEEECCEKIQLQAQTSVTAINGPFLLRSYTHIFFFSFHTRIIDTFIPIPSDATLGKSF